ncbi:hypothetical protein GGI42DRAFT_358915 [Trichoderma sp. SZMC 28013]
MASHTDSLSNGAKVQEPARDSRQMSINVDKMKTTWAEAIKNKDGKFATNLKKHVGDLFETITTALEEAKAASPSTLKKTVSEIEDFLFQDSNEARHIDQCILWLLLWWAAGIEAEGSRNSEADTVVFSMIIQRNPYPAFDNPYNSTLSFEKPGEYKSIRNRCPI